MPTFHTILKKSTRSIKTLQAVQTCHRFYLAQFLRSPELDALWQHGGLPSFRCFTIPVAVQHFFWIRVNSTCHKFSVPRVSHHWYGNLCTFICDHKTPQIDSMLFAAKWEILEDSACSSRPRKRKKMERSMVRLEGVGAGMWGGLARAVTRDELFLGHERREFDSKLASNRKIVKELLDTLKPAEEL